MNAIPLIPFEDTEQRRIRDDLTLRNAARELDAALARLEAIFRRSLVEPRVFDSASWTGRR